MTKRGRAKYRMRKAIVEPVFGRVKRVLGFRAFSLRGLRKVAGEWDIVCLALNLRRMAVIRGRKSCGDAGEARLRAVDATVHASKPSRSTSWRLRRGMPSRFGQAGFHEWSPARLPWLRLLGDLALRVDTSTVKQDRGTVALAVERLAKAFDVSVLLASASSS